MIFFEHLKKMYLYRAVFWDLSIKQLKAKYSGSMLGLWWAIIIPLLLALSINFVFIQVFKIQAKNYVFFILAGMVPWAFFSNALLEATGSFISLSSILKQGVFPREYIPFSVIFSNFLNFLTGLFFLLPAFILVNVNVVMMFPFLIFACALYLLFLAGLGLLFSVLNVFFRDLTHFLSIAVMIWFWVTPVFYSPGMVDAPYQWLLFLNPLTYFILFFQEILFKGAMSSVNLLLICSGLSLLSFMCGYLSFIKLESKLLKRI